MLGEGRQGKRMRALGEGRRVCAYCGQRSETMSREHVIPAALTGRASQPLIANVRTPNGEVAITGQVTVRDVCPACNNGPLSELDEYAVKLYDAYFCRMVEAGDLVRFEYAMGSRDGFSTSPTTWPAQGAGHLGTVPTYCVTC